MNTYQGRPRVRLAPAWRVAALFAIAAIGLALGGAPAPAQAIMGGQGLMWSVLPAAPVALTVCWLNPQDAAPLPGETANASAETRREWVRLALKRSWERYARVLFTGWGQCQDEANALSPPNTLGPRRPGTGDENIKVQITATGGGQNPGHGSPGDYASPGVILNLHPSAADNAALRRTIEFLAIHEFGHALGYYHEEERQDWPSTVQCPEQWSSRTTSWPWWPIPTEIRYGAADVASVMAYCSGGPTALSPHDIAGVQRSYERHLPGSLLTAAGAQCLAAHATAPNGENAFGWECDEALDDQEWIFDRQYSALYIRRAYAGDLTPHCLDVDTLNNSEVQIWSCHYGGNQQWQFRRIQLRGYGGLCITRPAAGLGAPTMQPCTGAAGQLWMLEPGQAANAFHIRAETAGLCLAARGSAVVAEFCGLDLRTFLPIARAAQPSTRAPAVPAASLPSAQEFLLIPGGELRPIGMAGSCLDVRDVWDSDYVAGQGGPAPGQQLQIFPCQGTQLNQRWNFSGNVVSGGKCLALSGNSLANGAAAAVVACDGSEEQNWDYYP